MKFMNAPHNYRTRALENRVIIPSINELNQKSISLKNINYEKFYENPIKTQENPKFKRVKGFKFTFEKLENKI